VFAMDKGEMRGPITNPRGLYIFYANDVKRTTQPPLAKIKDKLTDQLRRKALGKLTQAWVEDLRKKAYIEIK
jgi:parvulin-like peptidyl-prolyl isomerase